MRVLQVAKSVEYVSAGTTALVEAKRLQKGTRKLLCCGLVVVVIIIVVIVIVIVKPWQK
jgi:syntaxin 1B/2/3